MRNHCIIMPNVGSALERGWGVGTDIYIIYYIILFLACRCTIIASQKTFPPIRVERAHSVAGGQGCWSVCVHPRLGRYHQSVRQARVPRMPDHTERQVLGSSHLAASAARGLQDAAVSGPSHLAASAGQRSLHTRHHQHSHNGMANAHF